MHTPTLTPSNPALYITLPPTPLSVKYTRRIVGPALIRPETAVKSKLKEPTIAIAEKIVATDEIYNVGDGDDKKPGQSSCLSSLFISILSSLSITAANAYITLHYLYDTHLTFIVSTYLSIIHLYYTSILYSIADVVLTTY